VPMVLAAAGASETSWQYANGVHAAAANTATTHQRFLK